MSPKSGTDVLIVGAGQAGLATAYFLRRTGLRFVLLDQEGGAGGAWRHAWPSLQLFSPAPWSSLPGWRIPLSPETYPTRDQIIDYLGAYETRYELPIERPTTVTAIFPEPNGYRVETDHGPRSARAVVSATGTWSAPYVPTYPDQERFEGRQLHSAQYTGPETFAGQRLLVIGGGNSGAQILAEVSQVAQASWVTPQPPTFLPDDVDGRVLFERATARWEVQQGLRVDAPPPGGLGDIVMLPPVKAARERGVLKAIRPFVRFTATGVVWPDGTESAVDAVIWCTGFRPALQHLAPLGVLQVDGKVAVEGASSIKSPGLWLVGYGDWTGFASATLVGVMRSARQAAQEIAQALSSADQAVT